MIKKILGEQNCLQSKAWLFFLIPRIPLYSICNKTNFNNYISIFSIDDDCPGETLSTQDISQVEELYLFL